PNQVEEGYNFAWLPGGEVSNRLIIRNQTQSGTYQVVVRDAENCPVFYATYNVEVRCEPSLTVPTAFSPNQDGLNDVLQLFGKDLGRLDFRIFNRWGELVFASNQQEEAWDGTVRGAEAPVGTYLWTAKYVNILAPNTIIEKSGRVNLVR
ncbi:MAG: gliding motility-associated C-terminal domain-containing protein, partial [Microscillaceae bacterium]|nr:gliding motility-associated C-terminal domain-containing protein [Microscillaceae bacterium]